MDIHWNSSGKPEPNDFKLNIPVSSNEETKEQPDGWEESNELQIDLDELEQDAFAGNCQDQQ